jgi:hypothetical protein
MKRCVRRDGPVAKFIEQTRKTLTGIELVHQIKKNQFDVSAVCSPQTRTPQVWEAVLAA